MSIPVTSWSEVTQDDFDAAYALVAQIIAEEHPELHTRSGVIKDMVLRLHGVLGGAGRIERSRFFNSNSLLALQQNPDLADTAIVDQNLSNYRIVRNPGDTATGTITIVLSKGTPIVVPSGYIFYAGTRKFVTSSSFASRLSSTDVVTDTDRLMTANSDGTYSFTITVTADTLGANYNLKTGDSLTMSTVLHYVTRIYATQDFTGGQDAETNADLNSRLETGYAAQTWSNIPNIKALINAQTNFDTANISVIRSGSPEILRDKHGIYPISYGGRIDVWVKVPQTPASLSVTKTATYKQTTVLGPVWEITLTRDDLPGVYLIESLLRSGRASSAIVAPTSITRTYSKQTNDPDIANALEASFSSFQGMTIQFVDAANADETTLTANVSTATYTVTGLGTPNLAALQKSIGGIALGPPAGDVVIRGAVPCFMAVDISVDTLTSTIDSAVIANALATYINSSGFDGHIYAARLGTIAQNLMPEGVSVIRVQLSGLIYGPDGSKKLYRNRDLITAPNDPANMITTNTVAFYLDPNDVIINAL